MNGLIDFGSMFLVTNGLFFAALGAAETNNDKLKTGLSIAGLTISVLWLICTIDITKDFPTPNTRDQVLTYMPLAFIVGWLYSMYVHIRNWRSDQGD